MRIPGLPGTSRTQEYFDSNGSGGPGKKELRTGSNISLVFSLKKKCGKTEFVKLFLIQ